MLDQNISPDYGYGANICKAAKKRATFYFQDLAKVLDNGNMEVQIGRHLLECMEWGRAIFSLEKGLAKGNLRDEAGARKLLREAYKLLNA